MERHLDIRIVPVGHTDEPIAIVDHATGEPERYIDNAAQARFVTAEATGRHYPGLLAKPAEDYAQRLLTIVMGVVRGPLRRLVSAVRVKGNFSLVTRQADELSTLQRLPHIDAADPLQFTAVHYLCEPRHGGTGFFRHRSTALEVIDTDHLNTYIEAIERETAANPPSGYPVGDTPLFDLTGAIEAEMDRLIIYRAALLHSELIATPLSAFADDPRAGRLTGNLSVMCQEYP